MHLKTLTSYTHPAIPLWPKGESPLFDPAMGKPEPTIWPYLLENNPDAGVIIVCPGGGYTTKVAHESEPIALHFNKLGFHCFILDYRVLPYRYPACLLDAKRAVRMVRFKAASLGIKAGKIAMMGFSAGGHLSLMTATHFDLGDEAAADPVERLSSRPDAAVLCYTPIRTRRLAELAGENASPELVREFEIESYLGENTPPMFIMHTAPDEKVAVSNALDLAGMLTLRGIPCALHVYPCGPHGVALGARPEIGMVNRQALRWPDDCALFLREMGF